MAKVSTACLKQIATLWPFLGHTRDGEVKVSDPTEITVQWVEKESLYTDQNGDTKSGSVSLGVAQVLTQSSLVRLGTIEEIDDLENPGSLYEVKAMNLSPDVKGRETTRTAILAKAEIFNLVSTSTTTSTTTTL